MQWGCLNLDHSCSQIAPLEGFEISIADFGDAGGASGRGRVHFVRTACSTDG